MKQLFTLLLASCLILSTTASAQFSNHENKKSLKKVRERTLPAVHPLKSKEVRKAARLKNTAVMHHPTSSKHYNWTGDDWYFHQEVFYDGQGREIEMVSGLTRVLTEYDDVENMVTKWYQLKNNEQSPWTTYRKELSNFSDYWTYEVWELVDGELAITGGSKSTSSENTQDNITTEQWDNWMYNPVLGAYEMTSGNRDVTTVNNEGQILSMHGYYWEEGQWVLEYSDTYTYNNDDQLTQMTFCYYDDGVTECERLEFILEGTGAPSRALVYMDEGTGYELTGRYINLVWYDWGNVDFHTDIEVILLFATMQSILDPDGDLNSDANFMNFEQFEYDVAGNYTHQLWIDGQWVIDDYHQTETEGSGDVVTTSYYFGHEEDFDEDCNLFLTGIKQIMVVGTNQTTMTDYEWAKTSEPCGYEWVKFYEVIETTTATTQQAITRYMQAELIMESIEFEEWNAYGHPIVYRNSSKMGEMVISYEEYNYENSYDGSLRTSTITSFRDEQDGVFLPTEKIEYAYDGSTLSPEITTSAIQVFPTIFNEGFNVRLAQTSSLKLISAQGQTVWQYAATTGQLFVPGSQLSPGMYILQITTHTGEKEVIKLIKK